MAEKRKQYLLIVNRITKVFDIQGHPHYDSERLSVQKFYDDYNAAKNARNSKVEDICQKMQAQLPQRYRSSGVSLIKTNSNKKYQVILRTL